MATKEINTPIVETKTKNGVVTPITSGNGGGNSDYNADSIEVLEGLEPVRDVHWFDRRSRLAPSRL